MITRPKKTTKRKDSPCGRELFNKVMKAKAARKKTRVVRTRIVYRDIERLRITGEDTVVFTLPDESRLIVQWLKKKGESDVDEVDPRSGTDGWGQT